MERKNEHQREIKDPRKITTEFGGRIKNMKEKTYEKTSEIKNERRSERERSLTQEIMATD